MTRRGETTTSGRNNGRNLNRDVPEISVYRVIEVKRERNEFDGTESCFEPESI